MHWFVKESRSKKSSSMTVSMSLMSWEPEAFNWLIIASMFSVCNGIFPLYKSVVLFIQSLRRLKPKRLEQITSCMDIYFRHDRSLGFLLRVYNSFHNWYNTFEFLSWPSEE